MIAYIAASFRYTAPGADTANNRDTEHMSALSPLRRLLTQLSFSCPRNKQQNITTYQTHIYHIPARPPAENAGPKTPTQDERVGFTNFFC